MAGRLRVRLPLGSAFFDRSLKIMYYTSNYTEDTSMPCNQIASVGDIIARQQLLREVGATLVGETWQSNLGHVPVWDLPRELTTDEENELCLKKLDRSLNFVARQP